MNIATVPVSKPTGSLNALRHGLAAQGVLLPGELGTEYEAFKESVIESFECRSHVEIHVVEQLVDIGWRLRRLQRLEHSHHRTQLEEATRETPEYQSFALLQRAVAALSVLVGHAAGGVHLDPFPSTADALRPLLTGAMATVEFVKAVPEFPGRLLQPFQEAVDALVQSADMDGATKDHLMAISTTGEVVLDLLDQLRDLAEKKLDEGRLRIAATFIPPDDRASRRLARHRNDLEKSYSRLLGILADVRAQTKAGKKNRKAIPVTIQAKLKVAK